MMLTLPPRRALERTPRRARLKAHTPYLQQLPAPIVKLAREVEHLKRLQRPGKLRGIAVLELDRHNALSVALVVQGEEQLVLHPLGFDRIRRQDEHEPVAPLKCITYFIVPLLGADDIRRAIPNGYVVCSKGEHQLLGEGVISAGVGDKTSSGIRPEVRRLMPSTRAGVRRFAWRCTWGCQCPLGPAEAPSESREYP